MDKKDMEKQFKESVCTCGSLMRLATKEEIRATHESDLSDIPTDAENSVWICACGNMFYVSDFKVIGKDINISSNQTLNMEEFEKTDGKERKEWR